MSRAAFLAHEVVNSGTQLSKPRKSQGEFDIPEFSDESLGIKTQVNANAPVNIATTYSDNPPKDDITDGGENNAPAEEMRVLSVQDGARNDGSPDDISDDFVTTREKFVAVFQYLPQNEDELELLQGDHVLVVEKCDDGWYVGTCERTGAFGTFPGNYVAPA